MGELPTYRVAVRARKEPAGTYTYVITRIDDPNWAERTGESYSTPRSGFGGGADCSGSHSGSEEAGPIMTLRKRPRDPAQLRVSVKRCGPRRRWRQGRPSDFGRLVDIVNVLEAWEAAK